MTTSNLMEQFVDGVASAVTDVREKVVEEPWFGQAVTDQTPASTPEAEVAPTIDTPNDFEEFVQRATRNFPDQKEEIAPDNDIDR